MPPKSLLHFTREQLRALQTHPRKRLSQNFVIDPEVLETVVAAAELRPEDVVIEVGPGLGALTERLLDQAGAVIAIEYDERLAEGLRRRLADRRNLIVLQRDVLSVTPAELLGHLEWAPGHAGDRRYPPYRVVANLPYHITTPAIRQFLWSDLPPDRMVLMVQKEVAERIAAKPGKLSLLSVMVQLYAESELIAVIPPEAFFPAPEVSSAIVRLVTRPEPAVPIDDRAAFLEVVAAGFRHARKQLHNALPQGMWLPPETAEPLLREADIDPMRRAQSLTLEEWFRVYQAVQRARAVAGPESRVASPDLSDHRVPGADSDGR